MNQSIVVHRYADDNTPDWILGIPKTITLYVYDEGDEPIFSKSKIKKDQDPTKTFLGHIVRHYDRLESKLYFVTGKVNTHKFQLQDVCKSLVISGFGWIRPRGGEVPQWLNPEQRVDMISWVSGATGRTESDFGYMFYNPPQFVCTSSDIKNYSKGTWESLLNTLEANDDLLPIAPSIWSYLLLYRPR